MSGRRWAGAIVGVLATLAIGALVGLDPARALAPRDVIFDPSDVSLPNLEELTFDEVVEDINDYFDTEADPVRLKVPKFIDLGELVVDDATIEIATVTETITITGPMQLAGETVEVGFTLDWDESAGLIPDDRPVITVDVDYSTDIGVTVELTIGDVIDLVNDFAGTSFDATDQSPDTGLTEAGFTFEYDTEDQSASLDLAGGFRIDLDPDDLVVELLLSMTDPAGATPASLLTGLRLTDEDPFDDSITLRQVFRGSPGIAAFASEIELPEVTMSMVSPPGAVVKKTCTAADGADCVALRERPLAFFGSLADELPDDFAPGNTLTLAAALRLDSLGPDVAQAFGFGAGESALVTGAVGFDVTDLTEGDLNLVDVVLEAQLPTLSPGNQALLPDWLELSDGVLRVEYDDDNGMVVLGATATAGVSVPDQGIDLSVDVEAQITIEDGLATIAIDAAPGEGNVGWNDVFGLDWLDLTSVGVEVLIIAPEGEPPDVSGAITSSFQIGGQPFSVRLEIELSPALAASITVSFDGTISVYEVLQTVGIDTADLPPDLNLSLGPISVTAHVDDGPLQLSVGAEGGFPLLGPGVAEFLFSLRGDDVVFGVRSGEATLDDFIPDNPFGAVTVPMIAVVGTSTDFEDNSFNLSPEEDEFWRVFHGCPGDPRPEDCAPYTVDVDAGIHVMASFSLPDGPLQDLLPLLWIDPDGGLLLDAKAPFPAPGASIDLGQLSIRAVLPPIVPPTDVSPYPDWFERAQLAFEVSPEGLMVVGDLGIRLRDSEVAPSTSPTRPASCIRSWVPMVPGEETHACYDLLTFEIGAGIQFTTPPKLVLSGALLTEPGVGWPQPFGLDFLRIDAARIQLGLAPSLSGGLTVDLGFLAAGALFDKDFSGSIAMALTVQSIPAPPFVSVVPTFNGVRFSTQAGIELADFMELYDYVAETATDLGLPDLAPDLSGLPNISLRNLDLMVGLASYPDLCIEPGIKLGGTFHIGAPPLDSAPQNPPGGCNPGLPTANPTACAADPHCFASALLVATPDDGIIVSGSLGEFDVGVLHCDQALLDFRLTPTQQILKVQGGCEVPGLIDGSVDLYIGLDGVAFRGDVEVFPDEDGGAFRALIEGEAAADLGQVDLSNPASLLALDFDLHAVLSTDFTGAIRTALSPLIENLRISADVIDEIHDRLLAGDDPIDVILDLPDAIERAGGTVPTWLADFAGALEELTDTLSDYGIAFPSIDAALGGFDFVVTEGVRGYYEPEETECQKVGLFGPTGERGTVIDGECWDDPPGGPFNYEERGEFVDPSCRSAFDAPGIVLDGVCWAIPPVEVHIDGIGEIIPAFPNSFAELVASMEGLFVGILQQFDGVPDDLSLSTLLNDLADALSGAQSPIDVECVDFRLDSVEGSTGSTAALRFKLSLFGSEFGLATDWDFSQPALGQAAGLFDDIVATIFGTAGPVECEELGTTTIAAGSGAPTAAGGGDLARPSLTGFTVAVAPTPVLEGSAVTLTGTFNIAVPTPTPVSIDWGDGSPAQVLTVLPGEDTFTPTHIYVDDDPTGTAADPKLVRVTSIGRTETASLTVVNVVPSGLALSIDDVNEGAIAALHGTFADAGDADTHAVRINWGDGSVPQVVPLAAGVETFDVTHTYLDDNPTGTSSDVRPIVVTVTDDDGGVTAGATTVRISNVAPSAAALTPRGPVTEGRFVTYDLSFVDPGTKDTHTVSIDWGDGTPVQSLTLGVGIGVTTPLPIGHRYVDDNPTATPSDSYPIAITLTDDDLGASGALALAQTVADVAPVVELEVVDPAVDEGQSVHVVGSISDPGVLDTFVLTVDWGDAAIADTVVGLPAGALVFEADVVFGDNGTYTITADVVDDDTLGGSASGGVTVANVVPTTAIDESAAMAPNPPSGLVTFIVRAGSPLSLRATADDPGSDDLTFTWDFDTRATGQLDPGTATTTSLVNPPATDPTPSPTVQPRIGVESLVSKTWSQPCLYRVGLQVADDDGGVATDSTWVVVTGVETRVRNSGWWYNAYGDNRNPVLPAVTLECYRQVINHLSAVFGPSGSGEFRVLDTNADVRDALNTRQTADGSELLIRPLAATWLNLAHGALRWEQLVDTDGKGGADTRLSEVLLTAEAVRNNPTSTRQQLLAQEAILDRVNG